MTLQAGGNILDFALPNDNGETITLSALRGRIVVLFFYPKDDTSSCTLEARNFSDHAMDFAKFGAAVIGISPDSVKSHAKFKKKHLLSVALVSDESKQTLQALGLWVEKSMYGRKYMGVERTTVLIDREGKVARLWSKVKVTGHAAEVFQAARLLAETV